MKKKNNFQNIAIIFLVIMSNHFIKKQNIPKEIIEVIKNNFEKDPRFKEIKMGYFDTGIFSSMVFDILKNNNFDVKNFDELNIKYHNLIIEQVKKIIMKNLEDFLKEFTFEIDIRNQK